MPTPEELAHQNIDQQLTSAGWVVQDRAEMNLYAGRGGGGVGPRGEVEAYHPRRGGGAEVRI